MAGALSVGGWILTTANASLGRSGYGSSLGGSGSGADAGLGDSQPALGDSSSLLDITRSAHTASNYTELKNAIQNSQEPSVYIKLLNDIYMESHISVTGKKDVVVDGGNGEERFTIYEGKDTNQFNFRVDGYNTFTLQNVHISGNHNHGIVRGMGSYVTAVFDNVTYVGPQLVYLLDYGKSYVRNSDITIEDNGNTNAHITEEVFQNPQIYLEGEVNITHLKSNMRYIKDSVFWFAGAGDHILDIADGSRVTVDSGSYLFYGTAPSITIGKDASFIATACGGHGTPGHGDRMPNVSILDFTIKEGGVFSYTQRESTVTGMREHEQDYLRGFAIRGTFTMEPGSVFLYDTEYDGNFYGGHGGLYLKDAKIKFDSPKLFSVYNTASAFHSYDNGIISTWSNTNWTLTGIDAVNVWYDAEKARPANDHARNVPDLVWNRQEAALSPALSMGEALSFTIGPMGYITGPDIEDQLGSGVSLHAMLLRQSSVKRFALGTVDPFTVEDPTIAGKSIWGELEGENAAAFYTVSKGEEDTQDVRLEAGASGGRYELSYGENPRPTNGSGVTFVGNSMGLRAVLRGKAAGGLTLLSVPSLNYGVRDLPASTTVYHREGEEHPEGTMSVVVEDSRGPDAEDWTLTVRRSPEVDELLGEWAMPDKSLFFRDAKTGEETDLDYNEFPILIQRQFPATEVITTTEVWQEQHGILARIRPGEVTRGKYRTGLIWTFGNTP